VTTARARKSRALERTHLPRTVRPGSRVRARQSGIPRKGCDPQASGRSIATKSWLEPVGQHTPASC
jgi:hypothetical protein